MNRFVTCLGLPLLLLSSSAFAESCTDLARAIGRESNKVGDAAQISVLNTANLCAAKYESASSDQRAQIEASYGIFSGGGSGSSQQIHDLQESKCQSQYGSYWYDRIQSKEVDRVSQTGADVVRACINQQSFRLVELTIQDEAITAAFRYSGSGDTTVNGLIISPQEIAQCKALYNGKTIIDSSSVPGTTLKSGDTIALDCTRTGQSVTSGSSADNSANGQIHYKGGIIGIATVADVSQVPLIAYTVPNISKAAEDDIYSKILAITSSIQTEQARKKIDINNISTAGGNWSGGGSNAVADNAQCPSGQVVVGVNFVLGGTCNSNCNNDGRPVSSFSLVCAQAALH